MDLIKEYGGDSSVEDELLVRDLSLEEDINLDWLATLGARFKSSALIGERVSPLPQEQVVGTRNLQRLRGVVALEDHWVQIRSLQDHINLMPQILRMTLAQSKSPLILLVKRMLGRRSPQLTIPSRSQQLLCLPLSREVLEDLKDQKTSRKRNNHVPQTIRGCRVTFVERAVMVGHFVLPIVAIYFTRSVEIVGLRRLARSIGLTKRVHTAVAPSKAASRFMGRLYAVWT
ncbi:uncharacterized protein LOC127749028 [Frankliniella occidentalis]|uniref:Uncharacterized protein LOC127749028 n=1 Tax=Frankliniella occidentalis TaxID=133901 RepID=A0A9C6WYK3_FRAOC|nr:uncharacterized protein LOC127749028 [Frankliniella occidentalis]